MTRLAALLRRLADRIDPPPPPAPEGEVRMVSREELRRIQQELLQMIEDWTCVARVHGRRVDGLLWLPTDVLETVAYFMQQEVDVRDRDFMAMETNPTTVLR